MTTISSIIDDAYRSLNLIAVGQTPTAAQQTEALSLLNREMVSLLGHELGEPLTDFEYGVGNVNYKVYDNEQWREWYKDYYAHPNTRLVLNLETPTILDLYSKPEDGTRLAVLDASDNLATNTLTLRGNGRKIEGSTADLVLNTNGLSKQWFYRADLGDWKAVSSLALTDESPFPEEFDDILSLGVAQRLSPRYEVEMSAQNQVIYGKALKQFKARYGQKTEVALEPALVYVGTFRRRTRMGAGSY